MKPISRGRMSHLLPIPLLFAPEGREILLRRSNRRGTPGSTRPISSGSLSLRASKISAERTLAASTSSTFPGAEFRRHASVTAADKSTPTCVMNSRLSQSKAETQPSNPPSRKDLAFPCRDGPRQCRSRRKTQAWKSGLEADSSGGLAAADRNSPLHPQERTEQPIYRRVYCRNPFT
jgi:hypothetical protein